MWRYAEQLFSLIDGRLRQRTAWMAAIMGVSALLEGLSIGLILPFLALIVRPDILETNVILSAIYQFVGKPSHPVFIGWACITLLLLYLLKNGFLAFATYFQFRFVYDGYVAVASRLFDSYLKAPYVFHLRRNPAELLRNVTTECSFIFCQVLQPFLVLITEGLIGIVVVSVLIAWEPIGAGLTAISIGVPSIVFYRRLKERITQLGNKQQTQTEKMFRWVSQGIAGSKEAKVLGREEYFVREFKQSASEFSSAVSIYQAMLNYPRLIVEILAVLGVLLVVAFALVRGRPTQDVLPILGLFVAAAFRLMPSISRIVGAATTIRYYLPALGLVLTDLGSLEQIPNGSSKIEPNHLQTSVVFENVIFRYPEASSVALDNVSFTIPRGASLAITGPSGAGKTTLADVLLGLLQPSSGRVLVDGRDIFKNLSSWQNQIGYVPQNVYLYDDTIRRNIAFAVPDRERDDKRVQAAIEAAQLTDLIERLPQGLDTEIGERGVRLSGGQRQRLGIARALYHDPDILVMDEATSALDDVTESEVNLAIRSLAGRKTIIVIAHRLSTIEHCSMRISLERGIVTSVEKTRPAGAAIA